jgi:hypothetical protein
VKRPGGVKILAVLTFCAAAFLAVGSFDFFVVAVRDMTGGDSGDAASVAIAGMGAAGGFSMLTSRGHGRLSGDLMIPVVPSIVCHLLLMATAVWMLAYLSLPRVKQAFGIVAE